MKGRKNTLAHFEGISSTTTKRERYTVKGVMVARRRS